MRKTRYAPRARVNGLSLVEIMISLVIGLVVVGAVLVSYISSGQTNRRQVAYSEMNENAQIALTILKNDLLLAGYAQAKGTQVVGGATVFDKTFAGTPVFGCDDGFDAPNTVAAVACSGVAGTPPAIEISYEADVSNTVKKDTYPSDCLGKSLQYVEQSVTVSGNVTTYYITKNRYYLSNGATGRSELHCASASKTAAGIASSGQPLVDNVEAMKFWYGEPNPAPANQRQVVRYVTAVDVTNWQNMISVRTCVLMRSSEKVLTGEDTTAGTTAYLDCDSVASTSDDGYLRRAYFLTTTLRNKMTF